MTEQFKPEIDGLPRLWGYRSKGIPGVIAIDNLQHNIPYWEHVAPEPGPLYIVTAGMHPGPESTSIAAALKGGLDLTRFPHLKGRIIIIPQVNILGALAGTHDFPGEGDLNRLFPGDQDGSLAEMTAHSLFSFIKREGQENGSVFLLDLHCEDRSEAYVRIDRRLKLDGESVIGEFDEDIQDDLADALGITVVREYPVKTYAQRDLHHSLTGATKNNLDFPQGKAYTVELGESNASSRENVEVGSRCMIRLAVHLGMINLPTNQEDILQPEPTRVALSNDELTLVAVTNFYARGLEQRRIITPGYPVFVVRPNQKVAKEDLLGYLGITNVLSSIKGDFMEFVSPYSGFVVSLPPQGDYYPGQDLITMGLHPAELQKIIQ